MAPPTKPAAQRKRPYAVSLTQGQQAKFQTLGGSRWLQQTLDSIPEPNTRKDKR